MCICVCLCVYAISGGETLKSVDSREREREHTHELPEDVFATVRSTTDGSVLNDLFILNESLM